MFSLPIDSNTHQTRTQELISVSACVTLLDSRPRTDTRTPLRLATAVSCQGVREKDTLTSVIGYLY
jgi:hypothetical protein